MCTFGNGFSPVNTGFDDIVSMVKPPIIVVIFFFFLLNFQSKRVVITSIAEFVKPSEKAVFISLFVFFETSVIALFLGYSRVIVILKWFMEPWFGFPLPSDRVSGGSSSTIVDCFDAFGIFTY